MRRLALVSFASVCALVAFVCASPAYSELVAPRSSEKLVADTALQVTLSRRSIEIFRLAEQGDVERLRSSVPASAKFILGEHDVSWEIDGPEGAIAFAKRLQVSDFEFMIMDSGPLSISLCGEHKVTLWLLQPGGGQAYEAAFQYQDGHLTQVWAHDIVLYKGKIDPK
jgi:hypothetical protein